MKRDNTPQENLLLLIALAAEHAQHSRYSYAVTVLSVALELARKLAGEMTDSERECRCAHPSYPLGNCSHCGGYAPD